MFTLVPSAFFDPASERKVLAEVADLKDDCETRHLDIPQYDAVLVWSQDGGSVVSEPEILNVLNRLHECPDYNKILCSIKDGVLYLAIAQGKNLLLANSWEVQDFTTAEYYIFLSIKSLQINPEMSAICWLSTINSDEEMSLYRYFKTVIQLYE